MARGKLVSSVLKNARFPTFLNSLSHTTRPCTSNLCDGYHKALETLGNGPYLLRAECWTFDWNIGFFTDRMDPKLYFTLKNPVTGKFYKLSYSVRVTGYGLKFSHLLLVFGFRSEFSTFSSSVFSHGDKDVLVTSIPTTIAIKPTGSVEYSLVGSNFVTWNLEVDGRPLGRLTRVGTQYLGAGPLLGYMHFSEVSPEPRRPPRAPP